MATAFEIARVHQQRIASVTDAAIRKALAAWAVIDFADLSGSWHTDVSPRVISAATAAQNANAATSTAYVNLAARSQGDSRSQYDVNSSAFVGIDGSGRSLSGLLDGTVTTAKESIAAGLGREASLYAGQLYLAAMMKTALHDMSRSADLTASTAKQYTKYVRVVQPGACSRCAALAGIYQSERGFKRHPACKCSSFPVNEKVPGGFHSSPEEYFNSLSTAEQDRVFTQAGAEAIRAGADVTGVVTARRGATGVSYGQSISRQTHANSGRRLVKMQIGRNVDGSPIYGYATNEGVTRRGQFGKVNRAIGSGAKYTRLMPETIISLTDDPELRVVLLRDAGYLNVPGSTRDVARLTLAARDRDTATQFYRSLGIQLGG